MHELSIASSLIEEASKIAEREKALSVSKICVSIGELSGVEPESLSFVFPLAAEGSLLDKAALEITRVAVRFRCSHCGSETPVNRDSFTAICANCGSGDTHLVAGREIMITSLELETNV